VKVIILDSGPVWPLTITQPHPIASASRKWLNDLLSAGHRVILPEIIDYEVRRELLRRSASRRFSELDHLIDPHAALCEYLVITIAIMQRAAALWAFARQTGQPTANDDALDADMILIAQAESLNDPHAIIATTNIGHLSRFFPTDLWTNIIP
jgi:predicted nucleic acid-binding protein